MLSRTQYKCLLGPRCYRTLMHCYHRRIKRGWQGGRIPLKNKKNIGFLRNTNPDPLKNHRATKPAFNVGPSSARQRNVIWADDGPFIAVFGSSIPYSTKKWIVIKVGPSPVTKLSGSAHDCKYFCRCYIL